jgi:nucleotide-binding universal stress UspA family protein
MTMGDIDVADVLLSHAADIAADLIVMGGYGHSRLRQFVLGGVTRSILGSMTVPVFMSH